MAFPILTPSHIEHMNKKQLFKQLGLYSLGLLLVTLAVIQIIVADPQIGFHRMPIWAP